MRSVKRVAQKVNRTNKLGYQAFTAIGYQILHAESAQEVEELFQVLAGQRPVSYASRYLTNIKALKEFSKKGRQSDWEECSQWVEWWTRERHLSKLHVFNLIAFAL